MKPTVILAAAFALGATAAIAQTDVSGSSNTPSGVRGKPGAMTIRQASGGGAPHAPRTGRQPTKVPRDRSAGVVDKPIGTTHATTSRGMSGISKGPIRPAGKPTRR